VAGGEYAHDLYRGLVWKIAPNQSQAWSVLMRYDVLSWSVDAEHHIAKDVGPP
jgi:hypothetical protein